MVVFGGLEFIVGGYLVHRHYKNKNEKRRLEVEAQQRRHHTFPGTARPSPYHHQPPQPPPATMPPQKRACYSASQVQSPYYPAQPHVHPQAQPRPQAQSRPQPPRHAPTFDIPRKPLPHEGPQIVIQPLQRADSMATLSRMPVANGSRPRSEYDEDAPVLPPRRPSGSLPPESYLQPTNSPYGNAQFSRSTPAFPATPTSPDLIYTMSPHVGRHTVDDNWETYGSHQGQYSPTVSTELGEEDPPPPYRP